jgi:NAD+ kinase
MKKSFNNVLIVVKHTAYESALQLKAQGQAPIALRWAQIKERHDVHSSCVENVVNKMKKLDMTYTVISRDEMHRGHLVDKDLVITVGGDGTTLNVSSFMVDGIVPLAGINSDPSEGAGDTNDVVKTDVRRSRGALCAMTAADVKETLPRIIYGEINPLPRTRIQCLVRSTYTETRLPPALNDILLAHPIPAAVTRFRLAKYRCCVTPGYHKPNPAKKLFGFHAWSSGLWVCTPTGSSAAMHAAGGLPMERHSDQLQYKVREHLLDSSRPELTDLDHGMINPDESFHIRYNSHHGTIFVDGSHIQVCPSLPASPSCLQETVIEFNRVLWLG